MNVNTLIDELKKLPGTLPVVMMNTAIEDDESCPTFEITDIEQHNEKGKRFVSLQIEDTDFIKKSFNIKSK